MPLLQVRDFPAELYDLLALRAEEENRSISQQTTYLLKKALTSEEDAKKKKKEKYLQLLEEVKEFSKRFEGKDIPSPVQFIREDRDNDSFRR